jgi:streptogramin lyase
MTEMPLGGRGLSSATFMRGQGVPVRIAAVGFALAAAAGAQTPTPTPTPSPTQTPSATATPVNTTTTGVSHATEASANVNGVNLHTMPDGSVWFMEATADRIGVLRDHTITYWQLRDTDHLGANPVDFQFDGNKVWFIESGESTIPAGACVIASLDTTTGALTEIVVPGSIPAAFYRAPDGTFWLPQTSGRLQWVYKDPQNPGGYKVNDYRSQSTFAYSDLVVAPDGTFWLSDFGNNRIVHWTPPTDPDADPGPETSWTMLSTANGLLSPSQIQFDDQGRLWLSQLSANRMDRFTPATNELASFTGITAPVHFEFYQGQIYVTSSQPTSAFSILDPRIGLPITQTLTPVTQDVGKTPETLAVTVMTSTITPTTFDSPEVAVGDANINVVAGGAIGSLTYNLTALAHTYGITIDGGYVWFGADGQLVRVTPQTIGGGNDASVPVALAQTGAADAKIRVDVTLSNRGTGTIKGDVLYLFSGGASPRSVAFSLDPGATQELTDAFGNFGNSLFDGPVRIRVSSGTAADLVSSVRTTRTFPGGPTLGFEIPAASAGGSLVANSTTTLFTGARDTDISVLGLYTLDGASGTLTLVAPDGTVRGTHPFTFSKNAQQEFNPAALAFGVDPEPGDVVRVAIASGSVQAYVNVLDPGTTDVVSCPPLISARDSVIPLAGSVTGGGGKTFVTDVYLSNPGGGVANVNLTYYPLFGGAPQTAPVLLGANQSLAIPNVLSALFDVSDGQGSFLITSDAPVAAAARIGTHTDAGDYGAFAAAIDGPQGADGRSVEAIGLAQTSSIRSHLLFYNRGLEGSVTVTGFKADGTAVGPIVVPLGNHQPGRLDSVFAAMGVNDQKAGRVRIDVPEGMNVYAWAVRVDGFTGDLEIAAAR